MKIRTCMKQIDAEKIDQLILSYLKGTASEKQKNELLTWLKQDSVNARYFSDMKAMWHRTHEISCKNSNLSNSRRILFKRIFYPITIAASLVIVGLLGFSVYKNQPSLEIYDTMDGIKKEVVLADGTNVLMMPYSTISIDKKRFSDKRDVRLTGEAQFNVTHDSSNPFTVYTQDVSVRVLGTIFKMNDGGKTGVSEAILAEGSIELSKSNGEKLMRMIPGQKVSVKKNGEMSISQVDDEDLIMMKYGIKIIRSQSMEAIIQKLESDYNVDILEERINPKDSLYTISYPQNADIQAVLDILETISGSSFSLVQ